jgi:hypothetical protein
MRHAQRASCEQLLYAAEQRVLEYQSHGVGATKEYTAVSIRVLQWKYAITPFNGCYSRALGSSTGFSAVSIPKSVRSVARYSSQSRS